VALTDKAWYVNGGTSASLADLGSGNNAAGATVTITNATYANIPAGAYGVALVNEAGSTTAGTLSDGTNNYTLASSQTVNGTGIGMVFVCPNMSAVVSGTLTYTKHTTGTQASITAFYATGMSATAGTGSLDANVTATLSAASSSPSLTSGAATVAGDLIIGACFVQHSAAATYTQAVAASWGAGATSVTAQTRAQSSGGALIAYGKGRSQYNPTLSVTPTGVALIVIGIRASSPAANGYNAVTLWAASASHVAGDIVRQNNTVPIGNERCFVCYNSTSGTGQTGASEPAWVTTRGGLVTDNTVKWAEATGIAALNGDITNTPTWAAYRAGTAAATLGQVIQNTAGTLLLLCTVAGNMSGTGAEPSWSAYTTTGATTTDTSATWVTLGAVNKYSIWNSPHSRLLNAATTNWVQAGNSVFVSASHAEAQNLVFTGVGALGTTPLPVNYYSVNNAPGSTPPGSGDLLAGASLSTWTSINLATIGGTSVQYFNGFTFNAGTGPTASVSLYPGSGSGITAIDVVYDNCTFAIKNTNAGSAINMLSGRELTDTWNNCQVYFGNASQTIASTAKWTWRNGSGSILAAGSAVPTTLCFSNNNPAGFQTLFSGLDLSAITGTLFPQISNQQPGWNATLVDCNLGSGVTVAAAPGTYDSRVSVVSSDNGGTTYREEVYTIAGTLTTSTSIYRQGGASDGTTPVGKQITTTANSTWIWPFLSNPIGQWSGTGATSATVYGIINGSAVPNNDQIWIECEYFGSSGAPTGSFATSTKANNLAAGTPLTADSTSNWGTGVSARLNSHTYAVGAAIGIAANPNRVFFCTVSGSTSGAQPAGYATAIDGGTVTDGAATFRAGCRFSMSVNFTPQLAGYVYTTVKMAVLSTTTIFDPLVVL
jgi:hypothetical protein